MATSKKKRKTTVGTTSDEVLAFTAGEDRILDLALVEADCLGSAAHATMLAAMPLKPKLFSKADVGKIKAELVKIMRQAQKGAFNITLADQDVHLAVERTLTSKLGELGRKIHTGRSRNDQVAVDLRLFGKQELLGVFEETVSLCDALLKLAKKHEKTPMVGRTHLMPAMPSSVGLWASAHSESLLDDIAFLIHAYDVNDQCPLGSAAGYGVPLPIDRDAVAEMLGFTRATHNVLYASQARGKIEAVILSALAQIMLTLSRLAQDLILFSMPEFSYFQLPDECCTGSSIMPQKKNPDVLELIRAKSAVVSSHASCVQEILRAMPSGYNRDLQEVKKPFMDGLAQTRASLRVMMPVVNGLAVNKQALLDGFTPEVFATDAAMASVVAGVPFRDAYNSVKKNLAALEACDPGEAIAIRTHLGGAAGLDWGELKARSSEAASFAKEEKVAFHKALSKLIGTAYPLKKSAKR